MKHLQGLPVLVLGLGASGLAMARWCARHGAEVTVADTREAPPQLALLRQELPQARFVSGPLSAALIEGQPIRAVYRSPGLAPAAIAPVVQAARAIGLPVEGELDLFAQALRDLDADRRAAAEAPQRAAAQAAADREAVASADRATDEALADSAPAQAAPASVPALDEAPAAAQTAQQAEADDEANQSDCAATEVADGREADNASAAPPATLEPTAAVPESEAASGPVYVPSAAREAAAFVARMAALSAVSVPPEDEERAPEPAPVLDLPVAPQGYRPAVLAITGTNGKTTVTALTGELIAHAGKRVAVAGNIGPTLLDTLAAHIDADTLPEAWVLELSSFQLDEVQHFEPTAATVLNLSQDHLDWHGSMEAYAAAKARIFGAQGLMVLNRDDPAAMAMLPPPVRVKLQKPQLRAHLTFGADLPQRPGDFGIERINGMAWLVRAHEADETQKRKRGAALDEELHIQRLMPADALRIRGQHNALNALAALALAQSAGCPMGPMLFGLREYRGEPHRVEPVALIEGIEYFDDSKGTNVGATVAALQGLGAESGTPAPRIVVILGGDGKGQDFTPLAEPVRRHARAVVLIGRDGPAIGAALADTGVPQFGADSLDAAVAEAARQARPGDAVLLSPACASFDMFKDYAHRAQVFCDAVQALADAPGVFNA